MDDTQLSEFIERWEGSGAAERANYQLFLSELCDVIGVPHPDPATPDNAENAYVFERSVKFCDSTGKVTTKFIDLYKRGCFVLEAKQGADPVPTDEAPLSDAERKLRAALKKGTAKRGSPAWDEAMLRAKGQADQYIRALPAEEGRPPFLVVVDVGHSIELYSEFSCTGGTYIPFPAPGSHRMFLQDLERADVRERLHAVWSDPLTLDPTRRSARVTRDIAARLARLAQSLEADGHAPETVAAFLMRCLFTMFAEDVWLLGKGSFTRLLESLRDTPEHFVPMAEELWEKMNHGGFSTSLRLLVLRFNGGLFEDNTALPLDRDQLLLLVEAAQSDWRDVEPAIFGTLLERALNPVERHKLGAHYTPRAYVERLVLPTVIEPLRVEWQAVQAAAVNLAGQGEIKKAVAELTAYHRRLCEVRILDPACGSGNFLYVTLEHLKRIEAEVFDALDGLGERQAAFDMLGHTVDPHQLLGLEVNPRAAVITELVLWIGTLQWHYRTYGRAQQPPQPIIRNFHNIECRDAVLEWDDAEPVLDADGEPVTRWDGRTTKPHPVTGKDVPDETARVPVVRYIEPRPASWPEADYVVGNPPFIGTARMREALGDGYTEALRSAHAGVGESSDFVMYWWNHAAELVRAGRLRRFGLVTTNSLRQTFNRRKIERHMAGEDKGKAGALPPNPRRGAGCSPGPSMKAARAAAADSATPARAALADRCRGGEEGVKTPLSLLFAIPDHPWVDSADGAAVRIAMTVGVQGPKPGTLQTVVSETSGHGEGYDVELKPRTGQINADLTIGADVSTAVALKAGDGLCAEGMKPHGTGFIVTPEEAEQLGLGRIPGLEQHLRPYRNGRDITQTPRGVMVIDLHGLTADNVRRRFPEVYQWVQERVKPEREHNRERYRRENWWLFGRKNTELRAALVGLPRYTVTVKTAKHRIFTFLDSNVLPDSKLIAIALSDAYALGLLSSRVHCCWTLAAGARLGVGNDPTYVIKRSFMPFPFPAADEAQQARIRELGEQLDAHRQRQQALHPDLTLTDMYNVLEKLRATEKESAGRSPGGTASHTPESTNVGKMLNVGGASMPRPPESPSPRQRSATASLSDAGASESDACNEGSGESRRPGRGCGGGTPASGMTQLTPKEKRIHEHGLISVLKELHDELDRAVFDAYGWPETLTNDEILERLVALNAERAAEEARGLIRWLRPEYQNPAGRAQQQDLDIAVEPTSPTVAKAARAKRAWPKRTFARIQALRELLDELDAPASVAEIARCFSRARTDVVEDLLATLASLAQIHRLDDGRFEASGSSRP